MLASTYVLKFCNLKTNWGIIKRFNKAKHKVNRLGRCVVKKGESLRTPQI
jgi:hypothetical protein